MDAFDVIAFRDLTERVIAAEKPGFWGDWTDEQRAMYQADDWLGFSISRGYSEPEIVQYALWREYIALAYRTGWNPYTCILGLTLKAALRKIEADTRGEFLLTSHAPFVSRDSIPTFDEVRASIQGLVRLYPDSWEISSLVRDVLDALDRWRAKFPGDPG